MARLAVRRGDWSGRRAVPVYLALCAALTSACTTSDGGGDEKAASPAPTVAVAPRTSAPADPTEVAEAEAIAAYRRYWTEMEKAYAQGSAQGTALRSYAAGATLSRANYDIEDVVKSGKLIVGTVSIGNPTATAVDIDRKIPNVSLSSCLDVSHWTVVSRESRRPVAMPTNRLTRYVATAVVEKWPDGWKVIKSEPQVRAC
ncbi:hypothetical protein ACWCQL_25050 [Streptomyces sp. NPDC002073]